MEPRPLRWLLANAILWMAAGCAITLLAQRIGGRAPSLGDLADQAIARMQGLDLSEAQAAELARIRDEWRAQILAEERGFLDRADQAAAAADARVAQLLTPEQARRYRDLALVPRSK